MTIKLMPYQPDYAPAAGDPGTSGPGRAAVFGEKPRSAAGYKGPERRRKHRRGHTDRREVMRFNLDSTDRRTCEGRRSDDKQIKFW
jgi:hypothetical protein